MMIHRFCHHKFKPKDYKLPELPQNGRTTLVSTKLCKQLYHSTEIVHDFDATTPREYTRPPLMEYSSLHDPHLRKYFYRPEMAIKLFKNGFINKDLKVMVPLKVYNTYRKYMENESFKIHREKVEEEEEHEHEIIDDKGVCTKVLPKFRQSITRQICDPERDEKRKQFFEKQEEKIKARQFELQEQLKREIAEQERIAEDKRLEQQRREERRESEREQFAAMKLQKRQEERERAEQIITMKQEEHQTRLKQLHESRQKQLKEKTDTVQNRLKRYQKHTHLVRKEEEEKRCKEKELKLEKVNRRLELFATLQQREEEKKRKLSQYNRKQSQQLKKVADKFEQQWKESKENKIHECREKIERQKQFWARRYSQLPHIQQRRESRKYSSAIVNYYQEQSPLEKQLPQINEKRRSSAFSHVENGGAMNEGEEGETYSAIEEKEEGEGENKRKVRFGDAECMIDSVLSDTQ